MVIELVINSLAKVPDILTDGGDALAAAVELAGSVGADEGAAGDTFSKHML
jgi:hypothetical protein